MALLPSSRCKVFHSWRKRSKIDAIFTLNTSAPNVLDGYCAKFCFFFFISEVLLMLSVRFIYFFFFLFPSCGNMNDRFSFSTSQGQNQIRLYLCAKPCSHRICLLHQYKYETIRPLNKIPTHSLNRKLVFGKSNKDLNSSTAVNIAVNCILSYIIQTI